jgi:hypothetical protein
MRVADPGLGPVVRELWKDAYTGHESRELLLEMIWLAPMPDCSDLALTSALDDELEPDHRTYASLAVLAAGTANQKQTLAEEVLNRTLPQVVIRNTLPKMVPELIDTDAFFTLVNVLDAVKNSVHGLNYTIYRAVKNDGISRNGQITLRDQLADAIWSTRQDDCRMYQAHSDNDHFQDGLIASCYASIPTGDDDPAAWAYAFTIAIHFGNRRKSIIAETETDAVWTAVNSNSKLREAYLWACLKLADELEEREEDWSRFNRATSETRQLVHFNVEDQSWLLNAVDQEAPENRRGVAFHAITYFFDLRQDSELAEAIAVRISDRSDWLENLNGILNPQSKQPEEWELENNRRKEEQNAAEKKRVADWLEWREEVLNAPDFLMGGGRRLSILYDANKIVSQGTNRDNTWGHWDSQIIARTLSDGFLERYCNELAIFWRETDVLLRSERKPKERGRYAESWLLALAGVKAEAETIGWATSLSHGEAVKATRIACIELNGFGGYMATLDQAHPRAVAHVVAEEAFAELEQLSDVGQAEMFHDVLYHGTENMKDAVASRIAPHLSAFMSVEQGSGNDALRYAIGIIAEQGSSDAHVLAMEALCQQLKQNSKLSRPFVLSLVATLDTEAGCSRLLLETKNLRTSVDYANAVAAFAAVFGEKNSRRILDLGSIPEDRRVPLLYALVLRVYRVVRREDDTQHEGIYTPDIRDDAQYARSFLFNSLMNIKRPETLVALHQLAQQSDFAHMQDRLSQMAHEIAGQICDLTAHPLIAVQAIDRDSAFLPYDSKSLLSAMMTRLDSFEHDVLHAEDTPIVALRKLDKETDIRRFISNWLRGRDREVFSFTQEAVVVDEKRTDIRFQPRAMQGYATVELKRETWSVRQFEHALRSQLVGQYLQHENCRVGCLLICMANRKHWHHPDRKSRMSLQQVVSHLNCIATEIMASRAELQIVVKGIDYSVKVDH